MEEGVGMEGGKRDLEERIRVYVASMPVKRAPTAEDLRRLMRLRFSRAVKQGKSVSLSQKQGERDEDDEEEEDELYRLWNIRSYRVSNLTSLVLALMNITHLPLSSRCLGSETSQSEGDFDSSVWSSDDSAEIQHHPPVERKISLKKNPFPI